MKTIIYIWDKENDLQYNNAEEVTKMISGESVNWNLWFDGDGRRRKTKADSGDRFFLFSVGEGIVCSGKIGGITFNESKYKLAQSGMVHIELIPDQVGCPIVKFEDFKEIMKATLWTGDETEIQIENSKDSMTLEHLWLKAILNDNPGRDKLSIETWTEVLAEIDSLEEKMKR